MSREVEWLALALCLMGISAVVQTFKVEWLRDRLDAIEARVAALESCE